MLIRWRARPFERPVVGLRVHPPEPGLAEVGQPGAELVAQQPEQAEDQVAVAGRVAHDLVRAQAGLLLQQAFEDEQRVAERARDDDAVEAGELVAGEVVVGDAAAGVEVLRVGAGVEGADRDDEPQAVGRGDLAAAPGLRQRDLGLVVDQPGVGLGEVSARM